MHSHLALQEFLDSHYIMCNTQENLNKPDPLGVVIKYKQKVYFEEIALFCALLSYGSAKQIVTFLNTLDFSLLDSTKPLNSNSMPYYRFQSSQDIVALFQIFRQCIAEGGIKHIFMHGYKHKTYTPYKILNGIYHSITTLHSLASKLKIQSRGIDFAIGQSISAKDSQKFNPKNKSPLKRWNLFMRWMVRKDAIDFGIWQDSINPNELIIPLDTHTFKVSLTLGLLSRKTYDLAAAIELTDSLKKFCPNDPIRYDFALYRIGQENRINVQTI